MITKKVANYFDFSKGLNTDLGVLNRDPNNFTYCKNIVINLDGSIRRRRGIDFLQQYRQTIPSPEWLKYTLPIPTYSPLGSSYQRASVTGTVWNTFGSKGEEYLCLKVGGQFCIYRQPITNLREQNRVFLVDFFDDRFFHGDFRQVSNLFKISKTYFKQNGDLLFYADQFVRPGYLQLELSGYIWYVKVVTLNPKIRSLKYRYFKAIKGSEAQETKDKNQNKIPYNEEEFWEEITDTVIDTEDIKEWDAIKEYNVGDEVKIRFYLEDLFEEWEIQNNNNDRRYPGALEFYSGRLWLSGSAIEPNKVWYSQVIIEKDDYDKFHQEADPNNIQDPYVVPDDGGVISIVGADEILNIVTTQYSLLVLARNGVWEITGADGIFDATNFTVRKVTDYGLSSKDGFAMVEGALVYLSDSGIYTITKSSELSTSATVRSLSSLRIDNLLKVISKENKQIATINYDQYEKKIYVGLNIDDVENRDQNTLRNPNYAKDFLIYDMRLDAWYIWRFKENDNTNDFAINTIFQAKSGGVEDRQTDVLVAVFDMQIGTESERAIAFGLLEGKEYNLVDFKSTPHLKTYYKSIVSSAHQTYSDIMRVKKPEYLTTLFKRTEIGDEEFSGKDVLQSSCKLRVAMDFAEDALMITDKFGEPFISNPDYSKEYEIYPKEIKAISFLGNKSSGYSHVKTQHRVAGRGNVLQFIFSDGDHIRCFKALARNNFHPLDASHYWEEIEPNENLPEWEVGRAYERGNEVKVILTYDFHIIGWACELVAKTATEA